MPALGRPLLATSHRLKLQHSLSTMLVPTVPHRVQHPAAQAAFSHPSLLWFGKMLQLLPHHQSWIGGAGHSIMDDDLFSIQTIWVSLKI